MTTTTLATAGTLGLTAAGGYLFGPLGAGAGALVGSFLFGGSGQKVEGPRLGDLSVAASTYGGVIPVGFGTQKVAGTIVWATDIREEKHTNTQGGSLFGGGTKVVEYRYFASFAVALGEGPAGAVTRIWAGDKLIANLRPGAGASSHHPKYRFRIYLGSEDQQPDPLIRKHVPANAAPAHRGLVTIVFEDLPLDEFGNRVPPITAEVCWGGAQDAVANAAVVTTSYQPGHWSIDPARNRAFLRTGSGGSLVRLNLDTMTEEIRRPLSEVYPDVTLLITGGVDADGNLFAFGNTTGSRIVRIDGDSLSATAEALVGTNGSILEILSIYDLAGRHDFVLRVEFLGANTSLWHADDLSHYWTAPGGVSTRPRGAVAGRREFGRAEGWVLAAPTTVGGGATTFVTLRRIVIEPPFTAHPVSGHIPGLSFTDTDITAASLGFDLLTTRGIAYDEQNDRVLLAIVDATGDNTGGPRYLVSYSSGEGVVWMVPVGSNEELPKRIAGPDATMASHNEATLDLPITLTPTEAMTVALRQLYGAWLERVMHEWQTDWTHLDLEPGDVVQVALHDGSLFTVRLLQCELGANLAVSWQTVVEESSSYTVPAVPAAALNYLPRTEPVSSQAKLFLLDLPLLQDLDDVQRVATGTYWAGGAYFDPPWKGAMLFSSDDGAVYASVDETFAAVSWGAAINALPHTDTPFQTDTTSELRVAMVSGVLASVTQLEMLNGANRAALIRADGVAEIIQFQDVVLENGMYTLTNLLRGRRGTEVFTGGHAAGDLFVLLDGVSRRGLPLSRIGETLHHRLVGRGGELRDAPTHRATLAGRDLMPYAPAHLTLAAEVGGNIAVTWVRRTRVGGALLDGTGDVPVSEDDELYELVVNDGAGNMLRTVTDLSSPAFTYTAAMQAEDFPSGGPGRIAVWQISAQAGRGFEASSNLAFAP